MSYYVTDKCIKCKYTDCAEVCPVDCFHEGPNILVINPDICIDCGVCIPVCPIDAILPNDAYIEGKPIEELLNCDNLSDKQEKYKYIAEFNRKFSAKWPVITTKKLPLPEAEKYKDIEDKILDMKVLDL